jgi:hypothetical protein
MIVGVSRCRPRHLPLCVTVAQPWGSCLQTAAGALRGIVVATSLTFTMTEEVYGRLTDRLRHLMQFSEASRQAADEALALLEAAKEKKVRIDARDIRTGDELGHPADARNEQLDRGTAELGSLRDVDAVIYLLAVHKLVEDEASGRAHHLARAEAMAIIAVLNRVASAVLDEALASREEQSEPIGLILEAIAPRQDRE